MVQLSKAPTNSTSKTATAGSFFYYTGADVSNSATIAALLHSVGEIIDEKPQLWFGKHKSWNVIEATYCSYNAFSQLDVRVKVGMPGSIESFMIDSAGNRVEPSDKLWMETFICAMVRALITADNDSSDFSSVVEIRKINPLLTKECADQFFAGFEQLFFQGPQLGCSEKVQVASTGKNNLVDAFLSATKLTGRYDEALEIIHRLASIDYSVSFLEAEIQFMADRELEAVKTLHTILAENPLDGDSLTLEAEFCLKKGRLDLALPLATRAVNSSPSYFKPWAILVRVYILLAQYEQALITLNSCPMVTHKDKYVLKRINNPKPDEMHLPLPVDVTLEDVSTLNSVDVAIEHNKVDPSLINLPAANLKSTFADAYELLSEIVSRTGWESLLEYRTKVFVMDGESKDDESKHDSVKITHPMAAKAKDTEQSNDFRQKRLCERWLDNLFMLLYEDLRVYTMLKAEEMHFDAQKMEMKKTTLEWELTGLVAERLGHSKDAADCFLEGLKGRFSPRCSSHLLTYYRDEHKKAESAKSTKVGSLSELHDKILALVVRLLVWNHRWYCSFSPELILGLKELVNEVGRVKIENEVKVRFDDSNTGVYDVVLDNLEFLDTYDLIEKDDV